MKFDLMHLARDGVLAGSQPGQEAFLALLKDTVNPSTPAVVFLDFAGVLVATGSFLRESVVAYRNHVRDHFPMLYPVIANASQSVVDELTMLLQLRNDAFVICTFDANDVVHDPHILGVVDGKQQDALREVLERVETDAPTLAKTTPDQKPTVWNNRLSALVTKGLLMEVGNGKTKRYRAVLEGLTHGR